MRLSTDHIRFVLRMAKDKAAGASATYVSKGNKLIARKLVKLGLIERVSAETVKLKPGIRWTDYI